MILTSVLLPAPFSPTSACTSPRSSEKLTASSAVTPAKRLTIPSMRRTGLLGTGHGVRGTRQAGKREEGRGDRPRGCYLFPLPSSVRFRHELLRVGLVE